jgi:hypothetical protein
MARYYQVTKEFALEELRRYATAYPDSPPEVPAMGLMRRIDSWEEDFAIIAALNAYNREES